MRLRVKPKRWGYSITTDLGPDTKQLWLIVINKLFAFLYESLALVEIKYFLLYHIVRTSKPEVIEILTLSGEPTFELLGLGSWWPSGRLQLLMEWLHVGVGM